MTISLKAQDKNELPYYEIPEASKEYTAGAIASRMIDGLGFRYYWATEGLREKDLKFKPNDEARASEQTINHILDLTKVILNSTLKIPNEGGKTSELTFDEKRRKTLENLEKASNILRKSKDISEFTIIFKRGDKVTKLPFWNQINGPISDALWHTGQIVSFRRSSGNPLPKGVNFLTGKVTK